MSVYVCLSVRLCVRLSEIPIVHNIDLSFCPMILKFGMYRSHNLMPLFTFGHFLLRMRSFDHINTSALKSVVIFEFSEPVFL